MDESRDSGMQSGWPGEWPRPEQASAPVPPSAQEARGAGAAAPAGRSWQATEWPASSGDQSTQADQVGGRRGPKGMVTAVGLVLAGALAGGIGIAAVQHGSTTTTGAAAQGFGGAAGGAGGQGQPGQGQPGQGFPGGFGRDDGEQRFVGTVTTVSGSSVTVQTQRGTATYQVSSQTQVVKDGQAASLSDLAAGDRVLMHVIAGGSTPTVERIIAGRLPQPGGPGFPGGGDDGQQQGDGGAPGGSVSGGPGGASDGTTTGLRT